ncbi:Probable E3 ubiquitin-protein ligase HERC1 [Babesia microti strain RI]|uniref:Probable E3 ubiquitin-protein ligase HERC1 n=1 Tax=Babesia microti (strain RI) TaxID=1133968 RepID=A0A1R4ABR0_BABMR|nr:Probable E3 ubiquitin-protein ligase HERC1 [Babesia microti strain RI]SJK86436.1 Probable E3 ubiquitin-protein ligase HERC1 [Babesia microti strain RI]|eukprot:XP_021338593.1 Probable E3 ubiquitin-protein ligase HERC1 [Babesia microti strain RI]
MWSVIRELCNNIMSLNPYISTKDSQTYPNWSVYSACVDPKLSLFLESNKWRLIRYHRTLTIGLDENGRLMVYKDNCVKCITVDPSILDVQMSNEHLFVHYKSGQVKMARDFVKKLKFDPQYMDNLPVPGLLLGLGRIVNMSIGINHAGFVTSDGDLYIGGNNFYGQSGQKPKKLHLSSANYQLNSYTDHSDEIELVPYKKIMNGIKKVSCAARHTICLDKLGNVYSFGDDSQIQLGLGDTRGTAINKVRDVNIKSMAPITTAIPLKHLVTYKPRERHLQYIPQKLPITADDIITGEDFTVIKSNNTLFACGNNVHGQCGNNLTTHHQMLLPIKLPKCHIRSVSCGRQHCVAQLSDGNTYGWGFLGLPNVYGIVCPPKKVDLQGNIFCNEDVTIVNY